MKAFLLSVRENPRQRTIALIFLLTIEFLLITTVIKTMQQLWPVTAKIPTAASTATRTSKILSDDPTANSPSATPVEAWAPVVDFSLPSASSTRPEDILEEVAMFAAGGGGPELSCNQLKGATPYLLSNNPAEWLSDIVIESCSWQPGEVIAVSILFPDSKKVSESLEVGVSAGFYHLPITPDMPVGKYTFILDGPSGRLAGIKEVYVPSTPRAYQINAQFMLYSFNPNEIIRLLAYEVDNEDFVIRFAGWKQYEVDKNGRLIISIEDKLTFFIVGNESGLVPVRKHSFFPPWIRNVYSGNISCGGLVSRLTASTKARVSFTDGLPMCIRDDPGFSEKVLDRVPEGTLVGIWSGPQCKDKTIWWHVTTEKASGWMAEEQNGVYLLEPVK